jgi:hypothetical protein
LKIPRRVHLKKYKYYQLASMPLSHSPLSNFVNGNLVVGTQPSKANVVLHTSTFDEYLYMYAVNKLTYELAANIEFQNSPFKETLTMHILPDSCEQLVIDGMPLAPGTTVRVAASNNIAVYGHVLRDI